MNRYERLKVLGRGSFGVASLVRKRHERLSCDKKDVQLFVAKEVDLHTMTPQVLQETENEVVILKSLSHVNVVAYVDTFVEDETMHIVMEYADAGDLFTAVQGRRSTHRNFQESEALSILLQCGRGLRHIHARHVVHRDLKSQNIFLSSDEVGGCIVKIGDFGIAKVLEHTRAMAKTVIGTPSHLSPEVCNSKPYGTKADMWSLGVVFYELLTLEPAFKATNLAALVIKIVSGQPNPVPADLYSEEVRALVWPLLDKDPTKRPSAARLLKEPALRQMARLPALPAIVHGTSSGSISETETLTPASLAVEAQTPRSTCPDGECSVPPTPGSIALPNACSQGSDAAAWGPSVPEEASDDLLTELDVLSKAVLRAEVSKQEASADLLAELDVLSQAVLRSEASKQAVVKRPTSVDATTPMAAATRQRGKRSPKGLTVQRRGGSRGLSSHSTRFQRSLSIGEGFTASTAASSTAASTAAGAAMSRSSSRQKKPQRPRPKPLGESASTCDVFFPQVPASKSPAALQHMQLPALKPSSLPSTPSGDAVDGARASSAGPRALMQGRSSLQPLAHPPAVPRTRNVREPSADTSSPFRTPPVIPSPSGERTEARPSPRPLVRQLASLSEASTRSLSRRSHQRHERSSQVIEGPTPLPRLVPIGGESAEARREAATDEEEHYYPRLLGRCRAPQATVMSASKLPGGRDADVSSCPRASTAM